MRIKYAGPVAAMLGLLASQATFAADMPIGRPIYAPPVYAPAVVAPYWAGFYLGASAGYAWQKDDLDETLRGTTIPSGFTPISTKPNGAKVGVFAGYNWQFGAVVFGPEADIEWAGIGWDSAPFINGGGDAYETKTDWQASIRGRVGYAFDNVLLYATGGVAFANIRYNYIDVMTPATQEFSSTRTGWTVGSGVDWAFYSNLFLRAEYRYADFGDVTNSPTVFGNAFDEHHSTTENALRIGLAYKF